MSTRSNPETKQGVFSSTRTVNNGGGRKLVVEFRTIHHGVGVPTYELMVNGKQVPRLDRSLFEKLRGFGDEQLADYLVAQAV